MSFGHTGSISLSACFNLLNFIAQTNDVSLLSRIFYSPSKLADQTSDLFRNHLLTAVVWVGST